MRASTHPSWRSLIASLIAAPNCLFLLSRQAGLLFVAMVVGASCTLVAPALADPLHPLDFPSLGKVTLASGAYTIDTTRAAPTLVGPGTNLTGTISASGVAVFCFDDLTVNTGAILTAKGGPSARPVALLSSGNLTFAGVLNASGMKGGNGTKTNGVGGEGGAGSGASGKGTDGVARKPGGIGGSVNTVAPNVKLSGGGGGGGGLAAVSTGGGGGGGGGGGAIELGAIGTLTLTGSTLNVSGGTGGDAGPGLGRSDGISDLGAGGGGGSGGAVFLHAQTITLGGTINAHAGNGGVGRGNGDDGAGGRVVIQATANPGTAGISVAGGTLGESPRVGMITFIQPISISPASPSQ